MALRLSRGATTERKDSDTGAPPPQRVPPERGKVDDRVGGRHGPRRQAGTESPAEPTLAGPRSRTSVIAALALVSGLVAVLAALSGLLAGPGVALGVLAVVLGIAGMSATSRRHVAGKGAALVGLTLGLTATVFGILALARLLPWLDTDMNAVEQARDWMASYVPWLFPNR